MIRIQHSRNHSLIQSTQSYKKSYRNMDAKKIWTWVKIITTILSLLATAGLIIGGYFYFKPSFTEEEEIVPTGATKLDDFRTEFKTKMDQVKSLILNVYLC